MIYTTLEEIIAAIGKSNVTPKQLIQAAYNLGTGEEVAGEEELEIMENNVKVLDVEEEVEEEEDPDLLNKDG